VLYRVRGRTTFATDEAFEIACDDARRRRLTSTWEEVTRRPDELFGELGAALAA
jgi:hypothetical protein